MTVGELRKALDGIPDEMQVHIRDESWTVIPEEASVAPIWPTGEHCLGDGWADNYTDTDREPMMCFYLR